MVQIICYYIVYDITRNINNSACDEIDKGFKTLDLSDSCSSRYLHEILFFFRPVCTYVYIN